MYRNTNLDGFSLRDKQLCLTFDDGPGPHTLDIAEYLHSQGIKATFFVVGKYAVAMPEVLEKLHELGHLIGNHTYEHPDMPYYCSIDGDVQDQVIRTDVAIRNYIHGDTVFFRAPYGKWSGEVAEELNANLLTAFNHVGPVHWEIPGIDCYYWDTDRTVEEACEEYIRNIDACGKGIVVMHDEISDMDAVRVRNKTHLLVRLLIPRLLSAGYSFVGLDEVPEIRTESERSRQIILLSGKGNHFQYFDRSMIHQKNGKKNGGIPLELIFRGKGKVLFKTPDDLYLSIDPGENQHVLLRKEDDEYAEFDFIQVRNERFILRSFTGKYLNIGGDEKLEAGVQHMRQAEVFRYMLISFKDFAYKRKTSRIKLLKKRMLFIRSKLLNG